MGFNNEEYVEEILYTAHKNGYSQQLLDEVKRLRESGDKSRTVDLYNKALSIVNG
jgi:hypothetical protein